MARRKRSKNKYTVIILALIIIISGVVTYFQKNAAEEESTTDTNWAEDLANAGLLQGDTTTSGLTVDFIDVGQGDCALVTCNGKSMLIDCGEAEYYQSVKLYLKNKGISYLDIVVATHPHSDHIGGMYMLIEDFDIGTFIMPRLSKSATPTTKTYLKMITALSEKSISPEYSQIGKRYFLDKAEINILGPVESTDDLNSMSVVLSVEYGKSKFLFTGDAEAGEEKDILETRAFLDCDVLKVAHHGSETSSSEEFLKEANPSACVISVGSDNEYGHPHSEIMSRLLKMNVPIYRTDEIGTITFKVPSENSEIIFPN